MNLLQKALGVVFKQTKYTYINTAVKWLWPDDNKNTYIDKGYRDIPNLYAIIDLILQKSKIVPFQVYRIKDKRKHLQYKALLTAARTPKDYARAMLVKNSSMELVEISEMEDILLNPNPGQTTEEFFEAIDGYKLLTGNAYIWGWTPGVGANKDKPQQLHVPPATMVTIITGDISQPVKAFKLDYVKEQIPSEEICHIKSWKPLTSNQSIDDQVYGMSPLTSSRRLMQKYKDADIAQGSMFQNMGPAGILSGEKDSGMQEAAAVALKDRFKQLYGGSSKAGDIAVTSAAVKWTQIGMSPVDLNIIESKEEMLGELCNIYHVPIGLFTRVNSTENNMVESRKMLITDAVIPLVEARKGALNKWLSPKFGDGHFIEFDYTIFSEISQELDQLAETAAKMWWISPDEKRLLTNYDADGSPEMKKIYIPSNLIPIDSINMDAQDIDVDPLLALEQDEDPKNV